MTETVLAGQITIRITSWKEMLPSNGEGLSSPLSCLREKISKFRSPGFAYRSPVARLEFGQRVSWAFAQAKCGGLCLACESTRVCDETGRLPRPNLSSYQLRAAKFNVDPQWALN
jgi:hypothetical protein